MFLSIQNRRGRFTLSILVVLLPLVLMLVSSTFVNAGQRSELFDETVRAVSDRLASSIVRLRYITSLSASKDYSSEGVVTTGLLMDSDGWILTSDFGLPAKAQSAASPVAILVTFSDGSEQAARLVARDYPRRMVLLKTVERIQGNGPKFSLGLSAQPGETAIVLGRGYDAKQLNYSIGIISAADRLAGRAIQIDAKTSASNYGGPALNLAGEVLGIVSPLGPPGQRGEAWYDSGIGFVVPIKALQARLPLLQTGQSINDGWAGIQLAEGNPFSDEPIVQKTKGPAAGAGLQAKDRITQIAEKPTPTIARFRREIRRYDAGQKITLTFMRGEALKRIDFKLVQKPIDLEVDESKPIEPKEVSQSDE